jgi:diacylglycerol kinase (ATP)
MRLNPIGLALMAPEKLRFLANPAGGRGRVARRMAELERLAGRLGVPLLRSASAADLAAQARRAGDEGVERFLVAGGDGTVHWSLQGLAGTPCALAVLPMGSGNDMATVLGFRGAPGSMAEAALSAPIRDIDLGRIAGRWFGVVAGVGFDGEVNRYANATFRRWSGPAIYVISTLRVLATFQVPRMTLTMPEARFDGPAYFAAFANCPQYGGGMRIAPAARLDDGQLEIVIVRAASKLALLRMFPRVFSGRHVTHPAVQILRAPWAEVRFDRPFSAYGDGEELAPVPLAGERFECVPRAVRVVAPACEALSAAASASGSP